MAALFKVVTRGEIVEGHLRDEVRSRLAAKAQFGAETLDVLFSGRKAVLKKNQLAAQAQQWIDWFGALGLCAFPEMQRETVTTPLAATPAAQTAAPQQYRIVFAGKLQEGFDRAKVMVLAQRRWGLDAARMELMFTSERVVVRRNLAEAEARKQLESFAAIGMCVEADPPLPALPLPIAPVKVENLRPVAPGTVRKDSPLSAVVGEPAPEESVEQPFPSLPVAVDAKLAVQMARTELNTDAFRNYAREWDPLPPAKPTAEKPASKAAMPDLAPPPVVAPLSPPLRETVVPSIARLAELAPIPAAVAPLTPIIRQKSPIQRFLASSATTLKAARVPVLVLLGLIGFALVWLH